MNVESYIEHLKSSPSFMKNVTSWRVLPAREAKYADFPAGLDARLVAALKAVSETNWALSCNVSPETCLDALLFEVREVLNGSGSTD